MSTNRNHHYLPQFYMRNFSNSVCEKHEDKKSIAAFYIKESKLVRTASIRKMAQRKDFYKEWLDGILREVEDITAPIFLEIIKTKKLPEHKSQKYTDILNFLIIQFKRTQKAINEHAEVIKAAEEALILNKEFTREVLDESRKYTRPETPESTLFLMRDKAIILLDLKMILLRSPDGESFLTSDNPVIVYNQHFQDPDLKKAYTGLNHRGLIVFIPLNPKLMLFLYDPTTYAISGYDNLLLKEISRKDVDALNFFQACNADDILLFDNTVSKDKVEELVKSASLGTVNVLSRCSRY